MALLVLQAPLCNLWQDQLEQLPEAALDPPDNSPPAAQLASVPYSAMLLLLFLQLLVLPLLVPDPAALLPQTHLVSLELLASRVLKAFPAFCLLELLLAVVWLELDPTVPAQVLVHLGVAVSVALLPPVLEVQGSQARVPLEVLVLLPVGVWVPLWVPPPMRWLR